MGNFEGFQSTRLTKPQRSQFDLSHDKRVSTIMGRLTPVLTLEAVPSDTFRGSSDILLRVAPMLAPLYDQLELYVHYFFVPNRLLWANGHEDSWETFITGGRLGVGVDPVTAPVPPFVQVAWLMGNDSTSFKKSTLLDYLGVPLLRSIDGTVGNWDGVHLDVMPVLAYDLIWFEYYRDRNFINDDVFGIPIPVPGGQHDVADALDWFNLRKRAYKADYFTSALPFTQRGEEVLMPLAGTGSVTYLPVSVVKNQDGSTAAVGGLFNDVFSTLDDSAAENSRIENIDEVNIDSSSVSINDFRTAYAMQVWLERNAVGGSRYTESTQVHFGVKPQDSRLQRPEYIGGGRIKIKITEVVSTAYASDGDASVVPQGNMAGHGVAFGNTNHFQYFCTEHGFIMGIASIMNPPSYHQGMPRMFFKRRSFLDYIWPTFAKLGEQNVYDAELYATPASLLPDSDGEFSVFGYQSRYADWKWVPNTNQGDFHDTLLFWTLTRDFSDAPVLGAFFTEFDTNSQDRIFAVQSEEQVDNFWMYVSNRVSVLRPLPYFGTPNTLGFS